MIQTAFRTKWPTNGKLSDYNNVMITRQRIWKTPRAVVTDKTLTENSSSPRTVSDRRFRFDNGPNRRVLVPRLEYSERRATQAIPTNNNKQFGLIFGCQMFSARKKYTTKSTLEYDNSVAISHATTIFFCFRTNRSTNSTFALQNIRFRSRPF